MWKWNVYGNIAKAGYPKLIGCGKGELIREVQKQYMVTLW